MNVPERPPLKQPKKTFKPKVKNGNPYNRRQTIQKQQVIMFTPEQLQEIKMLRSW